MKMLYRATKDKNWFRIEETNDALDLNTGVFYENGNPTPHVPKSFFQFNYCVSPLDWSIHHFVEACQYNIFTLEDCPAYLHEVERYAYRNKIINLDGVANFNISYFIQTLASLSNAEIDALPHVCFGAIADIPAKRLEKELMAPYENITNPFYHYRELAYYITHILTNTYDASALRALFQFFVKQKLYLASPDFIDTIISKWIEWKTKLNEPLTECGAGGIFIELAEMRQRINKDNRAILDRLLSEHNDQKRLYFQNDQFIAYPLSSCAAFHDEAIQQENCIERMYLKDCAEGKTHIVAVRSVFNPSQSLITCEINPKTHEIKNWLCAHNADDTNINSLRFQEEYQKYLYNNIT